MAIHPKYAPFPITPEMRLWLRIDEECAGGTDESGCFVKPSELAVVLPWYEEAIRVWLCDFAGFDARTLSTAYAMKVARGMIRELGSARASVRAKDFNPEPEDQQSVRRSALRAGIRAGHGDLGN